MKVDSININGKRNSIEVLDKIISSKINKKLISLVLNKTHSNYKGRKAKTKKFMHKKVQVALDTQVEKHQYLLVEVLHMVQKANLTIKKEN